jgi:hypothetical protein
MKVFEWRDEKLVEGDDIGLTTSAFTLMTECSPTCKDFFKGYMFSLGIKKDDVYIIVSDEKKEHLAIQIFNDVSMRSLNIHVSIRNYLEKKDQAILSEIEDTIKSISIEEGESEEDYAFTINYNIYEADFVTVPANIFNS